jgi:hypothetical protein
MLEQRFAGRYGCDVVPALAQEPREYASVPRVAIRDDNMCLR